MAKELYTELVQVKVTPSMDAFLKSWADSEGLKVTDMIRRLVNLEQARQMKQLTMLTDSIDESPAAQMRTNGAAEFFPGT